MENFLTCNVETYSMLFFTVNLHCVNVTNFSTIKMDRQLYSG